MNQHYYDLGDELQLGGIACRVAERGEQGGSEAGEGLAIVLVEIRGLGGPLLGSDRDCATMSVRVELERPAEGDEVREL